jgi:hypothetical protein
MPNTLIDIDADDDLCDVTAGPGGAVNNEVRVVIADGVTKADAHKALQVISSALVGDAIKLN